MRKDIIIPHLGFGVYVRPKPKDWDAYASCLFSDDGWSVKLILPDNCTPGALAHELVHVLQAICRSWRINFNDEGEHMGTIMQWLMQTIQDEQRRVRAKKRGGRRARRSRKT
jgi:hypothetical protein